MREPTLIDFLTLRVYFTGLRFDWRQWFFGFYIGKDYCYLAWVVAIYFGPAHMAWQLSQAEFFDNGDLIRKPRYRR